VDWPTSPGKVLSSSVVQERDREDGHLTYHAEVVYEFNVNIPLTATIELHMMEALEQAPLHMPKKL
jgi:hypothetical protein